MQIFSQNIAYAGFFDDLWDAISDAFKNWTISDEQYTHWKMLVWDGGWWWWLWSSGDLWANLKWAGTGVSLKDNFLKTILRYLLWIVGIVSLSVFIYIWYELATAEWKQEKFTKAIKALVYLIVGLAVIPLSYIVVKVTTWFSF